jgi:hypothetical protein
MSPRIKSKGSRETRKKNTAGSVEFVAGAAYALAASLLPEFSDDGGTGVVELRFKAGHPVGVFVRSLRKDEPTKCERGVIANWELTPENVMSILVPWKLGQ